MASHKHLRIPILPIDATTYIRPDFAATDRDGRLVEEVWRNGAVPNANWREQRDQLYLPINSLRSQITDRIRDENYVRIRSHHALI